MDYSLIIIIVSIITALGVAGGLILNGLSIRSKTKTEYYQILKELQDEFVVIDAMNHTTVQYRTKFMNLHEKIAHLSIKKIISDDIASYFDGTFPTALFYTSLHSNPTQIKKELPNLFKYCENKNFKSVPPS